jgi:D-inositol-3-phosphate glycosyltransferase
MISEHASPLATLGGVDAGGQNVYVDQVARHLAERGHAVDVFTRRDDPNLPEVVSLAPGVRVIHVPAGPAEPIPKEQLLPWMDAFADWMGRRLPQAPAYDCIHANFFMSGLVGLELRQRLGLPLVVTFHALGRVRRQFQGPSDAFPEARLAIEERIVGEADVVLAECPQDAIDLQRLYAADPGTIEIVPCGFDPDEFSPGDTVGERRRLGLDPEELIVLQLGRMVPRKGVDNVIRAVARLGAGAGISAHLLIVGGASRDPDVERDPEIRRLADLAAAERVEDRVTFVGRRDRRELAAFYRAADVFVSTPWYEPFGITPLEAMACGTPVIGSDVGGIKFSVRDGETGFLVPPKDPVALAGAIGRLARDPALRARLSRNAVRHVNTRFTWERVARGVEAVYERAIAARSPAVAAVQPAPAAAASSGRAPAPGSARRDRGTATSHSIAGARR